MTPAGLSVTFRPDADALIDDLMSNLAASPANELDGQISDALRNSLFGRPSPDNAMGGQDLVGRNIFRSREVNLPTYAGLAECFGIPPDAQVRSACMGYMHAGMCCMAMRVRAGVLSLTNALADVLSTCTNYVAIRAW